MSYVYHIFTNEKGLADEDGDYSILTCFECGLQVFGAWDQDPGFTVCLSCPSNSGQQVGVCLECHDKHFFSRPGH
jgi:hypothetical protein